MTAIAHQEDRTAAKYDASHPVKLSDEQVNDLFYHRCTFPKSFEESKGDILTWYGFESAYRTYDPATNTYYQGIEERTYGKVYSVL